MGLALAAIVMLISGPKTLPPAEIERLARELGMVYAEEVVPFTK